MRVHCVESVRWLLKHDNLGRERAAPHQPSPAPRKWKQLFRYFTAGVSLIVQAHHLLTSPGCNRIYELKSKPAICAITKIVIPAAQPISSCFLSCKTEDFKQYSTIIIELSLKQSDF